MHGPFHWSLGQRNVTLKIAIVMSHNSILVYQNEKKVNLRFLGGIFVSEKSAITQSTEQESKTNLVLEHL